MNPNRLRLLLTFLSLGFGCHPALAAAESPPNTLTAGGARETRTLAGWTVGVSRELLARETKATERALELLQRQLEEIVRVVPAAAVVELRQVPLYFSPACQPGRSEAEFHAEAGWLRDNGRDPAMARGIEFSGVADFEAEMNRMPNFALHELAHGYHFRVLKEGFDNAAIKAAYAGAQAGGQYDRVERRHGSGKPNTFERAYAMTDPMEYFAESTEAYFSRNDFFPFTREELKRHDPEMLALLETLWGATPGTPPSNDVELGATSRAAAPHSQNTDQLRETARPSAKPAPAAPAVKPVGR